VVRYLADFPRNTTSDLSGVVSRLGLGPGQKGVCVCTSFLAFPFLRLLLGQRCGPRRESATPAAPDPRKCVCVSSLDVARPEPRALTCQVLDLHVRDFFLLARNAPGFFLIYTTLCTPTLIRFFSGLGQSTLTDSPSSRVVPAKNPVPASLLSPTSPGLGLGDSAPSVRESGTLCELSTWDRPAVYPAHSPHAGTSAHHAFFQASDASPGQLSGTSRNQQLPGTV
jgi:hypothetical protein